MSAIESLPYTVFDSGWEQNAEIDSCAHEWRSVPFRQADDTVGFVERCDLCGAPRCGSSNESGNCVDRRHHRSVHIYPDGAFDPLGGYLSPESEGSGS